jgi:hypothetical protein
MVSVPAVLVLVPDWVLTNDLLSGGEYGAPCELVDASCACAGADTSEPVTVFAPATWEREPVAPGVLPKSLQHVETPQPYIGAIGLVPRVIAFDGAL